LFHGDWHMGHAFRSYDDNTTAFNALGIPFDLEAATAILGDEDGTVIVLTGEQGEVTAWFAVPVSALAAPFPRADFVRDDARFRAVAGDPPALAAELNS
jgi:hypothetical protein